MKVTLVVTIWDSRHKTSAPWQAWMCGTPQNGKWNIRLLFLTLFISEVKEWKMHRGEGSRCSGKPEQGTLGSRGGEGFTYTKGRNGRVETITRAPGIVSGSDVAPWKLAVMLQVQILVVSVSLLWAKPARAHTCSATECCVDYLVLLQQLCPSTRVWNMRDNKSRSKAQGWAAGGKWDD